MARKLGVRFEYKEKIMSGTSLGKSLGVISDSDAGNPGDK